MKINNILDNYDKAITAVVGVSYGIDSMVLLHLCQNYFDKVVVVHINHHQREQSKLEESLLLDYCNNHQLEMYRFDYTHQDGNFHNAAHHFRYECFSEVALKVGGEIFTAHHNDDLFETIVYKLIRGSKILSSMGIKAVSYKNNCKVNRPLLTVTKPMIKDYATTFNIMYLDDESNFSTKYTRNQIRSYLEPLKLLNPNYMKQLQLFSSNQSLLVDYVLANVIDKITLGPTIYIDVTNMQLIEKLVSIEYVIDKLHIDYDLTDIKNRIIELHANQYVDLGNYQVYYEYDRYVFSSLNYATYKHSLNDKCVLDFSFARFELDALPGYYVRNYEQGDAIKLNFGHKKVSRIFIDMKLNQRFRRHWPVIVNDQDEVVAVLNYQQSCSTFNMCNYSRIVLKYDYVYRRDDK